VSVHGGTRRRFAAGATLLAGLLCVLASTAVATEPVEQEPPIEAVRLMEVHGNVTIEVDGTVAEAEVTTTRAPEAVRNALLAKARAWRFQPVSLQGRPSRVRTSFHIVLAASREGDDYRVVIDGLTFGDPFEKGAVMPDGIHGPVAIDRIVPPQYPSDLQRQGRSGGVMLAILVGTDGRPERVQVLQSLAYDFGSGQGGKAVRRTMRILEANAMAAAKRWRFKVPAELARLGPEHRTVRVPIIYTLLYDVGQPGYWIPVQRGPRHRAEWLPAKRTDDVALAASGSGTPVGMESAFTLLAPATGTTLD
jgi:TonB family protein